MNLRDQDRAIGVEVWKPGRLTRDRECISCKEDQKAGKEIRYKGRIEIRRIILCIPCFEEFEAGEKPLSMISRYRTEKPPEKKKKKPRMAYCSHCGEPYSVCDRGSRIYRK